MNWITNFVRPKINSMLGRRTDMPENLWIKDPETGEMIFHKDLEQNQFVIPSSGHHMKISAKERLKYFLDDGKYEALDNPKVREEIGYAINQLPYLQAQIGNEQYFQVCKAYFICGTPLASDAGMADGRLAGNTARAHQLLKEAGYDGTPVVLMHTPDLPGVANLAPVAKDQLERAGFKVDMQSLGWQTTVSRIGKKDPPAQGGWGIVLTSWGALDSFDPIVSQNLNATCGNAPPGWPCDARLEELRDQFAMERDPSRRKAIADEIQVRAVTLGTHFPLGEWYSLFAYRTNTRGWLPPMTAMLFWNAEKMP